MAKAVKTALWTFCIRPSGHGVMARCLCLLCLLCACRTALFPYLALLFACAPSSLENGLAERFEHFECSSARGCLFSCMRHPGPDITR